MAAGRKVLGRDAILAAPDLTTHRVEVPEWGGAVYVRGLTAAERDAFEASIVQVGADGSKQVATGNIRARLVVLGCCDEAGERLFTDEDVAALGAKSAGALERLFDTIRHLSAMTDEDLAQLEGNSQGQSTGLHTA